MKKEPTGWERENRGHFDEITQAYDKIRSGYPQEIFTDISQYTNPTTTKSAIEIGAGTGKATQPILDAGYNVTAIEISPNMATFLQERFTGNNNFSVTITPFEEAKLQENSYDLIYSATAYHWIDAEIGCPKVFRLLKSGGTFALFRYNMLPGNNEELNEAIQTIYQQHYNSHYKSAKKPEKLSHSQLNQPAAIKRSFGFSDLSTYGFRDITMKLYDHQKTFTASEYINLLETFSDHRQLPESNRTALFAGVKEAIQNHGNQHQLHYTYQLYMGRKP